MVTELDRNVCAGVGVGVGVFDGGVLDGPDVEEDVEAGVEVGVVDEVELPPGAGVAGCEVEVSEEVEDEVADVADELEAVLLVVEVLLAPAADEPPEAAEELLSSSPSPKRPLGATGFTSGPSRRS